MNRASALLDLAAVSILILLRLGGLLGGSLGGVTLERAGGREFAQLVAHHVFRDVDRNELPAVMYGDGVADEFGQNRRAARPGPDYFLIVRRVQRVDSLLEVRIDDRSLLYGASHLFHQPHFLPRRLTMNLSVRLLFRVL